MIFASEVTTYGGIKYVYYYYYNIYIYISIRDCVTKLKHK